MTAVAEWNGPSCAETAPSARIIDSSASWETLWRGPLGKKDAPPPIDWKSFFAVAVFAGARNTGGWSVEFLDPAAGDSGLRIRYRIRPPAPGGFTTQSFTQPYAVRLFPKTSKPIAIVEEP